MKTNANLTNSQETMDSPTLGAIIQKLGSLAPPTPENFSQTAPAIQRNYLWKVIGIAKEHSSLFTHEEMGHVWANYFLLLATTTEEEKISPDPETALLSESKTLAKLDPRLEAALKVVSAIIQNSNNYQDALRAGVLALENCIPFVGGIVAAITSLLWPQKKKSAWDQVKDQVNKVVQHAIFDNEYKIVQSQITAIQTSLNQYLYSPNRKERGVILIATMVLTNSLYERVNQSKYRHMLLGLMAPIGVLHLTILSERYNHYEALFGDNDRAQAIKELKSTYDQYRSFFDTVYEEWKEWRSKGLKEFYNVKNILWSKEYHYGVEDELGIFNFEYGIDDKDRAAQFKYWALNRSIADLADVLSSTTSYSTFFKGIDAYLKPILPALDTLILGHYLWTRLPGTGNLRHTQIGGWTRDNPKGMVTKIHIDAYNSIDGLQFIYPDMNGTRVSSGGGEKFVLDIKDKQCVGAKLAYANGLVFRIQFFFADGSRSQVYGDKGNWRPVASINATVGNGYKLASANFAKGSGPSGTTGINGIVFIFKRI